MVRHHDINQPFKNGNSIITLILGLFFAVFAGGALTYAVARPHFWLRANNAKVTVDGKTPANADAYRSSGGVILIHLANSEGVQTEYIYLPSIGVLAVADADGFSYRKGAAFAKTRHPPARTNDLRSPYNDPTLVVGEDGFEFATNEGLVRIEMPEPLKPNIPHNYF
jgi:hypothetical protein